MLAAVEMRAKRRPFFMHLATGGKTEHLVAAAVGEDRLIPSSERMETAECTDSIGSRPQVQMIGIGQDDLRAEVFQIPMRYGLDSTLRADSHESGRVDNAVRRREYATSRSAVRRI